MKSILRVLAAAFTLVPLTGAFAITYNYEPGVLHETDAFASFSTTGAEMAGMGVHVVYSDGTTVDATWQAFTSTSGGVMNTATNPFYIQAGNTGTSAFAWLLFNTAPAASIVSLSLDGQPGNTVFDVSFPFGQFAGFNFVGTAGTAGGREFDLSSQYGIYSGLTVTYSDAVALTDGTAVGDVFRRVTIDFAPDRPLGAGGLIEFGMDTDSLAFGSVLAPVPAASVPDVGATLGMLGVSVAGMAWGARRRAAHAP